MGKLRWEGARPDARRDEAVEIAWENCAGRERDRMLDGMKPWKYSLGKLRWEGARPDARRDEAVEIAWENCAGRERDRMLDGMKPWK